jgi:sugar phosphate isomerase/epimerase
MIRATRRDFLRTTAAALAAAPAAGSALAAAEPAGSKMKLGLCTYLWGQDWDLPTVIENCRKAKTFGVELRTGHKHGVELSLDAKRRAEVKKMFDDSPVTFVGPGSAECYDHPDPERLKQAIEATRQFVLLSEDCGGSGVKVRPNVFHPGVPHEKTIEQIGKSLNVVGKFAGEHGQVIRLEVHGDCSPLPIMRKVMDYVDDPHVGVCWNCNGQDLDGEGLTYNFNLVKDRFGDTAHVRELNLGDYPYQQLIDLLVGMNYGGWILLECRTKPADRAAALVGQREVFDKMVAAARA